MTPAALGLQPHPEGGWYRETWRADLAVPTPYGERAAATSILFLLEPGQSSRWHRVRSAELWLWQGGDRLELDLGGSGGLPSLASTLVVGPDPDDLQRLVPPGVWQAARPAGEKAVLVACVVAPGFDFADFELED
jgi:predicted cupin superfamily sugar epimerase